MVEQKLLTPAILRERLGREQVRRGLRASLGVYTAEILSSPLETLKPKSAHTAAASLLQDILDSPGFDALLNAFCASLIASAQEYPLKELLGEAHTRSLRRGMETLLERALEHQLPRMAGSLGPSLERVFPSIAASVIRFLRKPDIHEQLEIHGRLFLDDALGKLSGFQRFFITAGQYDRTLYDRMPELIDDLIRQLEVLLEDRAARARITAYLLETLGEVLCPAEPRAAALPGAPEACPRNSLAAEISRFLAGYCMTYTECSLGELFQRFHGGGAAAAKIQLLLRGGAPAGLKRAAGSALEALFREHGSATLAELFSLDGAKKDRLDALLGEKLLALADARIGELLGVIQIRTLVSERINSLSMIEVEAIVLDVMARQLKWINVFGGILGALIGGFQAFFSWFTG
jgi:uncharacterized membrane protein YheB (UPF0754 family)